MSQINDSFNINPDNNFRLDREGTLGHTGPFVAEIMSTVDPARQGRIRVWVESFGDVSQKYDESTWFTVSYLSPYYGVTPHGLVKGVPESHFEENGHAYGMWMNTPDVGTKVLVVFAEGDPNKGFYIGFIPEPQMNQMLPAIGAKKIDQVKFDNDAQTEKFSHASRVPVIEIDKKRESINDPGFTAAKRPIHAIVASQMWKQGIITDPIRGPISSSAQRESPSSVFGISTPGRPVYSSGIQDNELKQKIDAGEEVDITVQARKGGHTFVMDDGDISGENNLVRIRTSSGHQITMSDDGESIYILHANGNTWIELGAEGTIDIFAANSINMRTRGDFNIHSDKNINMHAEENIKMFAKKNVIVEADENLDLTGKKKLTAYSKSTVGIKSDGTLAIDVSSSASYKSGGHTEIKGSTIGLNNGSASSVTAPKALNKNSFPDTVKSTVKGWELEPNKIKSIASRVTTHEPWDGHGTGIENVKPYDSKN